MLSITSYARQSAFWKPDAACLNNESHERNFRIFSSKHSIDAQDGQVCCTFLHVRLLRAGNGRAQLACQSDGLRKGLHGSLPPNAQALYLECDYELMLH